MGKTIGLDLDDYKLVARSLATTEMGLMRKMGLMGNPDSLDDPDMLIKITELKERVGKLIQLAEAGAIDIAGGAE